MPRPARGTSYVRMAERKYAESDIRILEGLEPVRLRPGQFTRTDSPLHIVQEVIDNAVDEAIAGFARCIRVTLEADETVVVADDGRGIPVGLHPEKKIPVVQAVFTILYSGGKFDKKSGGAYSYAGGLHGVGVSVTNALCERLEVTVERDGGRFSIAFADGEVVRPLKRVGKADGHGTEIRLKPNPKYFDSPAIPVHALRELLRSKAVLLPGLKVMLVDARQGEPATESWTYAEGLSQYLGELVQEPPLVPVFAGSSFVGEGDDTFAAGEGAEWAFSWFERGDGSGASFVNLIPTPQAGTHVAGLRSAIFNALRAHIEHHGLLPKGVKLTADDACRNTRFVLSVRLLDPSFDNQTKDRLNTRSAVRLVEGAVQPALQAWLNHHPAHARVIADGVIRNALARQRSAVKVERRRSSSVVMLPGKLADCESDDASRTELFLVEGDSAGGSAKMARDKQYQAVLPLRGKGLNTWEKTAADVLENEEVADIATAVGIAPHSLSSTVDLSKLRYHKVCVLADADVDGFHIQTLLLTLFFRHFPQLVVHGHVFVARPPLFRIDVEAADRRRPARKVYAMDEAELRQWEQRLRQEGYRQLRVSRFKGLGEMDPPELWETTLNPDTRRLLRAVLPAQVRHEAEQAFERLMGKSNVDWRRQWMERRGSEVSGYY